MTVSKGQLIGYGMQLFGLPYAEVWHQCKSSSHHWTPLWHGYKCTEDCQQGRIVLNNGWISAWILSLPTLSNSFLKRIINVWCSCSVKLSNWASMGACCCNFHKDVSKEAQENESITSTQVLLWWRHIYMCSCRYTDWGIFYMCSCIYIDWQSYVPCF